jgi:hypothetical protein
MAKVKLEIEATSGTHAVEFKTHDEKALELWKMSLKLAKESEWMIE